MTAREFLKVYQYDERLVTGGYYPLEPVDIVPGDRVGVVMLNLGGPIGAADVEPFLYNLFMDPAIIDIPLPKFLRHFLCRFLARTRARKVGEEYKVIGGSSPINRLTTEQAEALETRLNERFATLTGAEFKTYVAMRHWLPSSEEAAARMQRDGVTKVILLPLYPQYCKSTTGSSLVYWKALETAGEIPAWPTTYVQEYATHPKYVQSLSERIDEGLQRFPRHVRDHVHLVFCAPGTPVREMKKRRDPYCCLVHSTVQQVMDFRQANREQGRSFHVSFQSKMGPGEWLSPSTPEKLEELASQGHHAVLMVPVAFVSDHIDTAFELDIELREEAEKLGIHCYEVTSGLNGHPLFIDALADTVAAQMEAQQIIAGDGAVDVMPRPMGRLPLMPQAARTVRCAQCDCITEAHDWAPARPAEAPERVTVSRP